MFKSFPSITAFAFLVFIGNLYAAEPRMPDGPGQGLPSRARDSRPSVGGETVNTADQEITTVLKELLSGVNATREPNLAQLDQIADTLRKNAQSLQRTDTAGQSNLKLLDAWVSYFGGDTKRARIAANAAYKTNPRSKDAENTYIMMCIANNDIRMAKSTLALIRKNAEKASAPPKSRGEQPSLSSAAPESRGILDFDANSVEIEMLDKSIGFSNIACLNGTFLPYKKGNVLLILLWSNKSEPEQVRSTYATQRSQQLSEIESYESQFARNFENASVKFLGLNLDAATEQTAVMETLMKNAWPWPQAMAQDSRNSGLAELASLQSEKPSLAILGQDGNVRYAGGFSKIILWMMAHQAPGKQALEKTPETKGPEEPNTSEVQTPKAEEVNEPALNEKPKALPQPKAQKSQEETFNPQAQDLYNNAAAQMKMGHILGYGTPIRLCRQILQEYPNTPEAEKARQLLRQVPDNKKEQFHITNEEMGL